MGNGTLPRKTVTQRRGLGGFDLIDIMQTVRSVMLKKKDTQKNSEKKPLQKEKQGVFLET